MDVLAGELGGYRLLRQIGEGGMGVVHLGVAPDQTRVAVKVLRPGIVGDRESRERLAREVAALRRVDSPRAARCLDADPWGTHPFVVTRFVPGMSLSEYAREYGPLTGEQLRRVAVGLAEALEAVHRVGVIHRDVKPSNVLLERDDPVLIDFGLAMALDEARLTQAGWLLGTPAYLAPEIVLGHDPTDRADIHSWATTIAFACTGRSPYGGGPSVAVMDRVRRGEHDLTGVPEGLRPVLEHCLVGDPRQRPGAAELCHWLHEQRTPPPIQLPVADRTRAVTRPVEAHDLWGADAPVRRPAVERALRWGAATGVALLVAAVASTAPYVAGLAALTASSVAGAAHRIRSQRWIRHQRRGPRRRDQVQDAVNWPWQLLRSIPSALLITFAAGAVAGLVVAAVVLLGPTTRTAMILGGLAFVAMLWWGPGSHAFRPVGRRLVARLGRPATSSYIALWILAILVAGTYALLETRGSWWWPADSPPWTGWGWRR